MNSLSICGQLQTGFPGIIQAYDTNRIFMTDPKATPHKNRLTAWHHICLLFFRHLAQKSLDNRQVDCGISIQSDEKIDCASAAPSLCGVALEVLPFRNLKTLQS